MNVFIIHHHLKTGGVTKIIQSQVDALKLKKNIRIKILTGEKPAGNVELYRGVEIIEIPEINYLSPDQFKSIDGHALLNAICFSLKKHIAAADILHIHNLNLGKNPVFTLAVHLLLKDGYRVFHHCHDFCEDRELNYAYMRNVIEGYFKHNLIQVMYPNSVHYRIGTLSNFDLDRVKHNIIADRCHLLPNPVSTNVNVRSKELSKAAVFSHLNSTEINKKLIVYPVRAITRKNIGEFILLAYLFSDKAVFLHTLAPNNPQEIGQYESWVRFCEDMKIPLFFNVGKELAFDTIMSAADYCVTTSYMEGFGMVYLEPWLFNTPVVGRELTNIVQDIKKNGIYFPYLYKSIIIDDGNDFSTVGIEKQQAFLESIINDTFKKNDFLISNNHLQNLLRPFDAPVIEKNKQKIIEIFSIENYGDKLNEIYRKLS